MKLYLDNCCYNRPYDDQAQEKIHLEGQAVLSIINRSMRGGDEIIGSPALELEIGWTGDVGKKEKVGCLYRQTVTTRAGYTEDVPKLASELSGHTGLKTLDAFHLSFAETAGADFLLTTDAKFEKLCSKLTLKVRVMNPLRYLTEVMLDEDDT